MSQTISNDEEYYDYSTLDAHNHFQDVLAYFFSHERNPYKFALAKKHYDDSLHKLDSIPTKRLFSIITGTNLVTTKMILTYKTPQGPRYKIKRSYLQLVQRYHRKHKRQTRSIKTDNDTPPSQRFAVLQTDDSTAENTNTTPHPDANDNTNTTPITENKQEVPDNIQHQDSDSVTSDITKHAETIEKDLDSTLADLHSDTQNITVSNDLLATIRQIVKNETRTVLQQLQDKNSILDDKISHFNKLDTDLTQAISTMNQKLRDFETQLEAWTHTIDIFSDEINNTINTKVHVLSERCSKLEDELKSRDPPAFETLKETVTDIQHQVQSTHAHTKKRLHQLKTNTKTFIQQQEDDAEILQDRIFRLEDGVAQLKRLTKTPVKTQLHFDSSSDSGKSISPKATYFTKKSSPSQTYQRPITPPIKQQYNSTHVNPDMDYLRKNIHLTCTEPNQILEFYIKLRLAVAKGGIHLKSIDKITKEHTIADTNEINTSSANIMTQSNALYTLLANEKYIPAEFTMAQNCILGYSTNMDGFAALKAMLKLTHPVLNKKRPANIPPTLSEATDIHNYEQNLRNYYLLHTLYNKTNYSDLDKSKQFLKGLDDDKYSGAASRIQHQLDTTEIMKIDLPEDYTLDNIASTLINITDEYDNDTTIVRMARTGYHTSNKHKPSFPPSRSNSKPRSDFSRSNSNSPKYTKTQCHACKQFGHIVTHCHLLPKVLAILHFKSKNEEQCKHVLTQHISNNTISSKRTFVRALQMAQVLPDTEESDTYLEDDIIVHAINDNDINLDDIEQQ